jgi:hypothetical protein
VEDDEDGEEDSDLTGNALPTQCSSGAGENVGGGTTITPSAAGGVRIQLRQRIVVVVAVLLVVFPATTGVGIRVRRQASDMEKTSLGILEDDSSLYRKPHWPYRDYSPSLPRSMGCGG